MSKGKQVAIASEKPVKLTDRQAMFVEQYFIHGLNGTEAVLATYNTTDRDVAASMASDLLSLPKVRARVDAYLASYHMAAEEVLARIAFHARGSIAAFLDPDSGTIDTAKAKDAKDLGLIKRYRTKHIINGKDDTETLEVEIEMYDAQAALRDLGKHLGLFGADASISLTNIDLSKMSEQQLEALAAGKKYVDVEMQK